MRRSTSKVGLLKVGLLLGAMFVTQLGHAVPFPGAGVDQFASFGIFVFTPDGSPYTFMAPTLFDRPGTITQIGRSNPFIVGSGNPPVDTGGTGLPSTPNPAQFVYPGPMPPFIVDFPQPTTGRRAINTEILSLDLLGTFRVHPTDPWAPILGPGEHTIEILAGIAFQQYVTNNPNFGITFRPSFGQVVSNDTTGNPNNDLTIDTDSFFDVFTVVLFDGEPFVNDDPFALYHGCVQSLPPNTNDDHNCRPLIIGPGGYEEVDGVLRKAGSGAAVKVNVNGANHSQYTNPEAIARAMDMEMIKHPGTIKLVPEPSTALLLLIGIAGLARGAARRRCSA